MRDIATVTPRKVAESDTPISKALALGTGVSGALSLIERYDAARRALELAGDCRRREFLVGVDVDALERASTALLEAATDRFEPRKCTAMLALVLDALPAAVNFDSATYRAVLAGLIETEEGYEIEWHADSYAPERKLDLRGYSRTVVSRAMRRLLMQVEFAPAPSKVMEALRSERSVLAHAHIRAERLLAERSRLLERERRLAEIEQQFAGRDRNEVIAELRDAPSAPDPSVERARRIAEADAEAKRWRKIFDGELDPFAHLYQETETSSLETPVAVSLDDRGDDTDDAFDEDHEARALERIR